MQKGMPPGHQEYSKQLRILNIKNHLCGNINKNKCLNYSILKQYFIFWI